eukprot:1805429-Pleurochrysis_carterae.AAC.6
MTLATSLVRSRARLSLVCAWSPFAWCTGSQRVVLWASNVGLGEEHTHSRTDSVCSTACAARLGKFRRGEEGETCTPASELHFMNAIHVSLAATRRIFPVACFCDACFCSGACVQAVYKGTNSEIPKDVAIKIIDKAKVQTRRSCLGARSSRALAARLPVEQGGWARMTGCATALFPPTYSLHCKRRPIGSRRVVYNFLLHPRSGFHTTFSYCHCGRQGAALTTLPSLAGRGYERHPARD